jgi:hypothetical protein
LRSRKVNGKVKIRKFKPVIIVPDEVLYISDDSAIDIEE